ncbi:MAG: YIP1 family protein [Bacteroidetes bacterium]|nr:YIP1 family protein [Bacteroidota bacterium]
MSNENFDFNRFVSDSKETLQRPKGYFETMSLTGGLTEPVIKSAFYGAAAGALYFLWSLLHLSVVAGPFGGAIGIMVLIWTIIGSVIGLFIGAVIVLIISAIAKGNTDFEACARISASLMVLLPVAALFSLLSAISLVFSLIVGLAINLYGLWLLYNALTISLKADQQTSKIITIVLAALLALFTLLGIGAKRATTRYLDKWEKSIDKDTKELLEDFGIK